MNSLDFLVLNEKGCSSFAIVIKNNININVFSEEQIIAFLFIQSLQVRKTSRDIKHAGIQRVKKLS